MVDRNKNGHFTNGNSVGAKGGRPKGSGAPTFRKVVDSLYERGILEFEHPDWGKLSPHELAATQLYSALANGEPWAIQDFLNRYHGKPSQSMEIVADTDGRLTVQWKQLSDTPRTSGNGKSTPGQSDSA